MRYTRYDYKKKKGESFFLWLVVIIIISIALGMGVYKLFIGNNQIVKNEENTKQEDIKTNDTEKAFGIIQCGLYSNRNNADGTLKTIPEDYEKIIVEDNGSFKLIAGIYSLSDAEAKSQELTKASISNFRVACKLDGGETENKMETEIIDGYVKIISKVYEKDVKNYDTKQFKTWVKEVSSTVSGNSEELGLLLKNIESLPDEYKKENSNESLAFLYNILIKYKQN